MDKKTKNIVLGFISVAVLIAVIALVTLFQEQLGASVIGAKGGRISVRQGSPFTLKLPVTAAPSVKVELCQEGKIPEKCALVAAKVSPKMPKVTIPRNAALGKATIKVTERAANGAVTQNTLMRRAVLVAKVKPTPEPQQESSGGGGGGNGGGGSNEGANNPPAATPIPYELSSACYGLDQKVHLSWKPRMNFVRYRKVGESEWSPDITRCGFNGCSDYLVYDNGEFRSAILYGRLATAILPNTDFEIQIVPYISSPDGSPENSQIYRLNTGPLPTTSTCRSLL